MPYRVVDASGAEVPAVTEFLGESVGVGLLPGDAALLRLRAPRLAAVPAGSGRAVGSGDAGRGTRLRALAGPGPQAAPASAPGTARRRARSTRSRGSRIPAETYAIATRRHARAVIHAFYEYHRVQHGRPLINPFPAARGGGEHGQRATTTRCSRGGGPARPAPYQPKAARRIPRAIPDERFNEVFAALASHRDRALLAFWISTGARAQELLTVVRGRVDPADQLIGVVRKGSRALQMLPASADAFVWLRLYQHELGDERADRPGRCRCGGRCDVRIGRCPMTPPG